MTKLLVSRGQYDAYEVILKGITNYEVDADVDFQSNDVIDMGVLGFASSTLPVATEESITSFVGSMHYNALVNDGHFFKVDGLTEVAIDEDGLDIRGGWLELAERNAPPALANHARMFAQDISGKTTVLIQFGTGFPQVISAEP